MEFTHVSCLKGFGMIMSVHSTLPFAGTGTAGSETTTSGIDLQPSGQRTGGGAPFASPSRTPLSTHFTIVSIWLSVNDGSFAKCPYRGSAPHGGILRVKTAAFMALAQGRVV